jgi:hypothetical protein
MDMIPHTRRVLVVPHAIIFHVDVMQISHCALDSTVTDVRGYILPLAFELACRRDLKEHHA